MKIKIFIILIMISRVVAQGTRSDSIVVQNQKALLFSIDEFRLDSFHGGIGLKYWIPEGFAVLGKINYSSSNAERAKTEKLTGNNDRDIMYGALLGLEKHFSASKYISPYIGVSIGAGYENKNGKVNSANYIGDIYSTEQTTSTYSYTLNISFGAELFILECISLAGQYNFGAAYNSGEEEYKTPYSRTTMDATELHIGISSGELILAVYF
jgi:hypothetical protein